MTQQAPLQGTLAVTDYGWYEYLRTQPDLAEVNFWRPSARRTFLAPEYSPFLFKLRAPYNAICGFGYFARYAQLPIWLAWDSFGDGNGSANLADMQHRPDGIRTRIGYQSTSPMDRIGCILIVEPTFFAPQDWVQQPADWPAPTQSDKRYDLSHGEGMRVWEACKDRAGLGQQEAQSRYGEPITIQPRLGQGTFRVSVSEAYDWGCAISGEHSVPVLDAAHIRPVADDGPYSVTNGLLLRADIHRLFDQGYITVTPGLRVEVSARLREDYENGRSYYPFHGGQLRTPRRLADRPSEEFLRWHNEHCYRG